GHPDFRYGRAIALLAMGQYEEGFREYESRGGYRNFENELHRFNRALWNGEKCSGASILIYCEQGFGDIIQFARFIPLVSTLGMSVSVSARSEICPLLRSILGVAQAFPSESTLPQFDLHVML